MSWPVCKIADVFEVARGGSPRPIQDYLTNSPDGLNWIMIGDASDGSKYITATKNRIKPEGLKKSRMVHEGDFLLTNSMSFGRPYILKTSGCIHDGWLVLSPKTDKVSPDFFYYLLGSEALYREFSRRAAGAVVKNLNSSLVRQVSIPFPPLAEQKRIAGILDAVDALRAKRRESLDQLDTLLQSTFLDMFGDPVSNPMGWENTKLIDLCDAGRGISYGVVQRGSHDPSGVPVIRIRDILGGEIDSEHLIQCSRSITSKYKRTILRGGELVISIRGTVGRIATVPPILKSGNITRELALIPLRADVIREFVLELIRTEPIFRRLAEDVKGIAQKGINLRDLRELNVIQPPLKLQHRFSAIVESVERQKAHRRAHQAELDTLFASLQHRAFEGEL